MCIEIAEGLIEGKQYIVLLRDVKSSLKYHCTKGEIKFVTNRIISDFRRSGLFGINIERFSVDVAPTQYSDQYPAKHQGNVHLNKGLVIYYDLAYD